VSVLGGAAAETIRVANAAGGAVLTTGLATDVRVTGAELSNDRLELRAGAGNDTLDASGLSGNRLQLRLFGEAGDDRIIGSAGADFINGGQGTDNVSMGAGNDRFQWNPGEGSDVIDGQAGFDTHEFNGSAGSEIISLAAGGNDVLLTRNLGNIVMNQDHVERVEILAANGTDTINIGELRGTDVKEVLVNLALTADGTVGDGVADTVNVSGGSRSEVLTVAASGDDVVVNGLANQMRIANTDVSDTVVVQGGGGADIINAAAMPASGAGVDLDGGSGDDVLIAGAGDTRLLGGAGDDILVGNIGDDQLDAGTGDDILFGGGGDDLFRGEDDFTIIDFRAGAGTGDRIDLRNVAGVDDFGDVLASARGVFGGVVLDFGDDEITLLGVNAAQLHTDDFLI
jgi:Ca2+-binding RTX toxin-like protein